MNRPQYFRLALLLVAVLTFATIENRAAAQDDRLLMAFAPVSGTLASGGSEDWLYTAPAGAVVSLFARSTDGTLDPVLTVIEGGTPLLANDDYAYPDSRDSALEAIMLPRAGTYTVRVSAYGSTAGAYSLVLLRGYGQEALLDTFDALSDWEAGSDDEAVGIAAVDGQLELTLSGLEQSATALNTVTTYDRAYIHADFADLRGRGGWQVALLGRMADGEGYAFELNQQGSWRLTRRQGDEVTTLRDWTTHPAIVAGAVTFRLGMMIYGENLDLFYNDQYIGTLRDAELARPGGIGIAIRTGNQLDSSVTVRLNSVSVTIPTDSNLFPTQVLVTSDSAVMLRELERRGAIRGMESVLSVGESFVDLGRAGVISLPLGSGTSYEQFALAAYVTWESGYENAPVGCGLVFGAQDETTYTLAYIMQNGNYGVSPRLGDIFAPGISGALNAAVPSPVHLMTVVNEQGLYYFVQGQLVGSLEDAANTTGGIGISVVNEAPLTTTCRYRDLWLATSS